MLHSDFGLAGGDVGEHDLAGDVSCGIDVGEGGLAEIVDDDRTAIYLQTLAVSY